MDNRIIGVTVQIKGTTGGSITDVDGKFKIAVNDVGKATLVFSFIGYTSEEVALKGRTFVKMILKEAYNELEEVTVVAYGTQKKETFLRECLFFYVFIAKYYKR